MAAELIELIQHFKEMTDVVKGMATESSASAKRAEQSSARIQELVEGKGQLVGMLETQREFERTQKDEIAKRKQVSHKVFGTEGSDGMDQQVNANTIILLSHSSAFTWIRRSFIIVVGGGLLSFGFKLYALRIAAAAVMP